MIRSVSARRRALLLLLLLTVLAAWAFHLPLFTVPESWNPWAPLRLDEPPNLWTRMKLTRASNDPQVCSKLLGNSGMKLSSLEDRRTAPGCGFTQAFRVTRTSVAIGEPVSLSCRAALSLAMWERHDLQQAAERELGARVRSIQHFGSYACRNLYGQTGGARSQHATADAIDIAGFELTDGRVIRVVNDWPSPASSTGPHPEAESESSATSVDPTRSTAGSQTPEQRFLREIHDGACRWFDVVLGPDYNRAHADHLHFDRGNARACR